MRSLLRTHLELLLGAACLLARPSAAETLAGTQSPAVSASPSPLELRVRYRAAPGCPSSSEFLRALGEHLASGGDGEVSADVAIARRPHEPQLELRLRLHVGGRDFTSVAHAPVCEDLVHLAALNAALARGPLPLAAREAPSPTSFDGDVAFDGDATPAALPVSIDPSESLVPSERAEQKRTATLDSTPVESTAHAPGLSAVHWLALAELRAAGAWVPRWAHGEGAALGLVRDAWSLRLGATWWQPIQATFDADGAAPLALQFEQRSVDLAPCWTPALLPTLRLGACALLSGHRIQTREQTALLGSLGAGALGSLRVWEGLRLEARAALQVATRRPEFGVGALLHLYRSDLVSPLFSLALGWEFGAEGAE
jgi:hypothetical protein